MVEAPFGCDKKFLLPSYSTAEVYFILTEGAEDSKFIINYPSTISKVGLIIGIIIGAITAIGLGICCYIKRKNLHLYKQYEALNRDH